ncbi:hypothetical protein [Nocardia sp. CA-120079]
MGNSRTDDRELEVGESETDDLRSSQIENGVVDPEVAVIDSLENTSGNL